MSLASLLSNFFDVFQVVCRGCFRSGVAADLLFPALSESPDETGWGGNVCTGFNFSHAVLLFLGNRQEFSKAWLHLLRCCSQLCHRRDTQISLLAVCMCCCVSVLHVLLSWRDRRCRLWSIKLGHYNTHWL